MNYKFSGFLIFLVLFSFSPLQASEIKDKALYNKYLKQVEGYLNSLKDVTASFKQTSNVSNEEAKGKIYLSKPGKARWEYDKPKKVQLIINEKNLVYYDKTLDQVSYVSTPKTVLDALLKNNISLAKDFDLVEIFEDVNKLFLTLTPKEYVKKLDETEGQEITLVFNKAPFYLSDIIRKESEGVYIKVELQNITKQENKLDEKLFVFENKKAFEKRTKN
ncbi:MAG: LolA family protein [Alphaproteobacteria bacterium]|jgi:outer membrane lipoprotein-sorting protein